MIRHPFRALDRIARVTEPLLILHGTSATRGPPWMGQRLFDAAAGPKDLRLIPDTGHVELFGPDLWALEIGFLRGLDPATP